MTEVQFNSDAPPQLPAQALDSALSSLALIAGYYRIAADTAQLRHQLALTGRLANGEDLVRGANILRLKSRILRGVTAKRLAAVPYPVIMALKEGAFAVIGAGSAKGRVRLVDPISRSAQDLAIEEAWALSSGEVILITRRLGGAGADPDTFGFDGAASRVPCTACVTQRSCVQSRKACRWKRSSIYPVAIAASP